MKAFETGATRDGCDDKYDYEGFCSPLVIEAFGEYMHAHRKQSDGNLRGSDNWQNGIPQAYYMKSLWRHFLDLAFLHRGYRRYDVHGDGHELSVKEVCCAILFNVQGYLFEELQSPLANPNPVRREIPSIGSVEGKRCQVCVYAGIRYDSTPCNECAEQETPVHQEAKIR